MQKYTSNLSKQVKKKRDFMQEYIRNLKYKRSQKSWFRVQLAFGSVLASIGGSPCQNTESISVLGLTASTQSGSEATPLTMTHQDRIGAGATCAPLPGGRSFGGRSFDLPLDSGHLQQRPVELRSHGLFPDAHPGSCQGDSPLGAWLACRGSAGRRTRPGMWASFSCWQPVSWSGRPEGHRAD